MLLHQKNTKTRQILILLMYMCFSESGIAQLTSEEKNLLSRHSIAFMYGSREEDSINKSDTYVGLRYNWGISGEEFYSYGPVTQYSELGLFAKLKEIQLSVWNFQCNIASSSLWFNNKINFINTYVTFRPLKISFGESISAFIEIDIGFELRLGKHNRIGISIPILQKSYTNELTDKTISGGFKHVF